MGPLTLSFLWHMHQPYYVDLARGRATLPWVRLHALKDYYDLPALARRFPSVHQTFNLVPSLLDQLAAYADGTLTDPFLEVALRGAHELTREDRLFLLQEYFSYHPPTMGARLPRLEELRHKRGARAPDPSDGAALAAWRESDYRDLQVLFHLAWSGPALSAEPLVDRLIRKGRGFTQEDLDALLWVQREFLVSVEAEYRRAALEGTIEISASPYYHPILPLLCDTVAAREAQPHLPLPGAFFRHTEDARTQVRQALVSFETRFGARPAGMWPSEGSVSNAVLRILAEEGLRWTASDEDILFSSLRAVPESLRERTDILHRPYLSPSGTALFFRDHFLSDRIGFVYATWDAHAAADDFMGRLLAIADASDEEDRVVSVILDGENAWEYYTENGVPFLSSLFSRISASDRIRARTFSEVLEGAARRGTAPAALPSIRAGSWIRADFTTWIGDPVKNAAWDLLTSARAALGPPDPATAAGRSMLAAEGSDWFWWFGDEHSSAHDADFDRTFRTHIANAFSLAGHEPPASLERPLSGAPAAGRVLPRPAAPLSVRLDGRASDYFEWLPAARHAADLGSGTMSRGGRIVREVYYGIQGETLAIRIDTQASDAHETLDGLSAVIELTAPSPARHRAVLQRGIWRSGPVHGALDRILEMLVPLGPGSAAPGASVSFRVLLEDAAGRRIEAVPADGYLAFELAPPETDWVV